MSQINNIKPVDFDLKSFLEKHQKFKATIDYTFEEINGLLDAAKVIYQDQSALCELDIPINIVGDIHGQFSDLQRIFTAVGMPGKSRYLFLGDYVDRGPQSLECICSLVAYKLAFPNKIFLLRGNHECDYVNRGYGFWDEIQSRFQLGPAIKIFKMFNELFNYFPLAALIRGRILCMHGGLSPHLKSLNDIRKIQMPLSDITSEGLSQDLLWSDPKYDLKGFRFNDLRECSVLFGEDVVLRMCKRLNIDLIVRAHQNNKGAVLRISSTMVVSFVILNPVTNNFTGLKAFKSAFIEESTAAYSSLEIL